MSKEATINLDELILPLRADSAGFNKALKVVTAGIGAVVAVAGLAIKATFDWADELDSLQDVMGVTNKTAAALNFVLRKSGTDTETFSKGMVILEKGLVKADGSLDASGLALRKWGIRVMEGVESIKRGNKIIITNKGHLKDQTQLVQEIAEKYGKLATQQERVNFLTEVFGKSGAQLVDFFDTLAAEGGLDAVTKKVQAFGLAIDPNRYEQFNRNLEELKLIGLGLAVQFTEKVMPTLEKFLGWFTEFAQNPDWGKALQNVSNFAAQIMNGLANNINNWLDSGGAEKLNDNIISWIEGMGDSNKSKSLLAFAAGKLLKSLGDALKAIDWAGIAEAADNKLAETISSHDWVASGDAFGDAIDKLFSKAVETANTGPVVLPQATLLVNGTTAYFQTSATGQALGKAIRDWFTGAIGPDALAGFDRLGPLISGKLKGWGDSFKTWASGVNATVAGLNNPVNTSMTTTLTALQTTVDNKLREIAKTFFNRALAWTQQMIAGFKSGLGGLIGAISSMVGIINGILKKIITSFTIGIKLPSWLGGGGATVSTGSMGGGSTAGGGSSGNKRASGGPVIAGQPYQVGEFGPEMFTPKTNGTISQLGANQLQRVEITNWNAFNYLELATQIVKAQNNQ